MQVTSKVITPLVTTSPWVAASLSPAGGSPTSRRSEGHRGTPSPLAADLHEIVAYVRYLGERVSQEVICRSS